MVAARQIIEQLRFAAFVISRQSNFEDIHDLGLRTSHCNFFKNSPTKGDTGTPNVNDHRTEASGGDDTKTDTWRQSHILKFSLDFVPIFNVLEYDALTLFSFFERHNRCLLARLCKF
jgi:hypothetical protein